MSELDAFLPFILKSSSEDRRRILSALLTIESACKDIRSACEDELRALELKAVSQAPPKLQNAGQKIYLTPDEAAAFLGRSVKTLANYRSRGGGPPYFKRGRIYYREDDLTAWLNAAQKTSTSQN